MTVFVRWFGVGRRPSDVAVEALSDFVLVVAFAWSLIGEPGWSRDLRFHVPASLDVVRNRMGPRVASATSKHCLVQFWPLWRHVLRSCEA